MFVVAAGLFATRSAAAKNPVPSPPPQYRDQAGDVNKLSISEALGLVPPILMKKRLDFDDGGTSGYVCGDSKGTEFAFCMDRRLINKPPYPFFWHATHPEQAGAIPVKVGSELDASIIELLHSLGEPTGLKKRR